MNRIISFGSRETPYNCEFGGRNYARGNVGVIPFTSPPRLRQLSLTLSQNVLSPRWDSTRFTAARRNENTRGSVVLVSRRRRRVTLESRRVRLPASCHICTVLEVRSLCSCTRYGSYISRTGRCSCSAARFFRQRPVHARSEILVPVVSTPLHSLSFLCTCALFIRILNFQCFFFFFFFFGRFFLEGGIFLQLLSLLVFTAFWIYIFL